MWGDSFDGIENDETGSGGSAETTSKTSPPVRKGVSAEALALALRDHGAELAPEEWLSLIRPFAARNKGKRRKRERKSEIGRLRAQRRARGGARRASRGLVRGDRAKSRE
jgi:hypothetical protein